MSQDVFGEHIQNAGVTDPGKTYFKNKDSFHLANQSRKLRNAWWIFFGVFVGMFDENSSRLIPFKSSLAQRWKL